MSYLSNIDISIVLFCRPLISLTEHAILDIIVIVETLCGDKLIFTVFLVDTFKQRFSKFSFLEVQVVCPEQFIFIKDRYFFEQQRVVLQYTHSCSACDVLALSCRISKIDTMNSLFIFVTRIAVGIGIEVISFFKVFVRNEIAVGVLCFAECPAQDVAIAVFEHGTFVHRTVHASEIRHGAVFGGYFPRVVLRTVTFADNLGKAALYKRIEAFVFGSRRGIGGAVGAVVELTTHEQVTLAFLIGIETGNTPAGFDVDALQRKAPTITYIRRTAITAVLQTDARLHARPSFGQFKGIA